MRFGKCRLTFTARNWLKTCHDNVAIAWVVGLTRKKQVLITKVGCIGKLKAV